MIEETYVRATIGGTGECKCMGNYAASILAGEIAHQKGFDQVLWLDGRERKYVPTEKMKVKWKEISEEILSN